MCCAVAVPPEDSRAKWNLCDKAIIFWLTLPVYSVTSVFRRREGRIRLGDERLEECESDFSDDDCDAPFGGYRHRDGRTSLKLPEKVDEKDACI